MTADSANRAAVCDFDAINELYTVEYARVVELIRQTRGRGEKLDLLGTSFAASRWAQLIDREIAPAVGRGVIVSPLLPGVSGSRLDAATKSMADRMFAASLSGCVELECYGEIDLNEPSCEDSLCPSVLLSEMTGMEVSAVSEGLAGLMPLVEENGPLVARLVNEMDVEGLRGAMEQGRESYLWLDEFGDIHRTGVHVLGAICPTVTADRETPEPYRSCSSVPHLAPRREGHSQDMFDEIGQDNPFNPDIMCFVLTQPDTVIGLASTEGSFFGKSSFSDTWFDHPGHGDLALGAEVLLDFISSPGQSCQSS